MKRQTLMPVKQALVPFHGGEILAVLLSDGRIAASILSLCTLLKLSKAGQVQRILRDVVLAKELLLVIVQTTGGPQVTEVLTARAIPTWLTGLQPNMVAPEKRPLITALKEEAMEVLYRHFFKIEPDEKTPPQPNQATESPRSPRKMAHRAFERLHQAADVLSQAADGLHQAAEALHEASDELNEIYIVAQEQDEALGDHIVVLETDVAALKQGQVSQGEAKPRQQTPQDGPILTAEHRNQVYALARHLRGQTGVPIAALFAELAESFGVEDMSDIPDVGWEQVKAWFWLRTQRPNTN